MTPSARNVRSLFGKIALLGTIAIATILAIYRLAPALEPYALRRPAYPWSKLHRAPRVLVLGSSTLLYGLDDTLLSQSAGLGDSGAITLGASASTAMDFYASWLAARWALHPDVVLIGLDPWLYTEKQLNSTYYYSTLRSAKERFRLFFSSTPKLRRSLIFSGDPLVLTLKQIVDAPRAVDTLPASLLGASDQKTFIPSAIDPRLFFGDTDRYAYYQPFFERMHQLVNSIESTGAKVLFVLPPKRRLWLQQYRRDCRRQDSEFVLRFNREVGPIRTIGSFVIPDSLDDNSYMRDDVHLEYVGRLEFSPRVGRELQAALAAPPAPLRHLWEY